ncbi:MAG: hypothetical protein H0W58_06210 [Acidobacteria bacterium]|jgi:LAS superfamily LD-carboxypeptidase LdcB|nr:hypothetical protein [Acidobacteriota bacterium]
MKRMTIICLVFMLLTSSACSTEVADTKILTPNNQETNQNKERQEVNENLAETNTRKEQVVQTDKISIKNTKGLIVLSDRYGKNGNDFIRFYNEDGSLWYEFTYHYAVKGGKYERNENFLPLAFHPDYFILALKCVAENKNRYEVIVNEETELKKFVKKDDPTLKFQTWEDYITKAFAIDFNQDENPLRETPEGKVKDVDLPKEVTFHPVKVEGEWLKVSWDVAKHGDNAGFGWVKWKENQKLLVELFNLS